MKKFALLLCSLAAVLLPPTSMFADTIFNFGFQTNSNFGYLADIPYGGSGQLDTQATSTPGVYLIVGATGKLTGGPVAVNGRPLTGVGGVGSADNLLTVANGVGSFEGPDGVDLLFSSGQVFFGNGFNPVNQSAGVQLLAYLYYQDGPVTRSGFAQAGFGATPVAPIATATPEPNTFVLLATGTMGLVGLMRRRLFTGFADSMTRIQPTHPV